MKKVKILNVQFDVCTKDEALKRVIDLLQTRPDEGGKQIVTPNPEMLLMAGHNAQFRDVLNKAWLSIPDGIGILWASTFQSSARKKSKSMRYLKAFTTLASLIFNPKSCKKIIPERVTGVDLMESICAVSKSAGLPIFLLGAKPGIAEKTKDALSIRYPGVNIVGTFSGSPCETDFLSIRALMAETRPMVLFVAYGSPMQELWIAEHLKYLASVKIAMGVGGSFDFISGVQKRAPKWMRKLSLEWLYRLVREPSRFKRIWNATVRFPIKIIKS